MLRPQCQVKGKGQTQGQGGALIIIVINMSIVFMMITIIIYLAMTDMGYVSIKDYITRRLLRTRATSSDLRQPCLVGAFSFLAEDGPFGSSGFAF